MPLHCDIDAENILRDLQKTTSDQRLRMCLSIALAWKSSLDQSRALLCDLNNQNCKLIKLIDSHLKEMKK